MIKGGGGGQGPPKKALTVWQTLWKPPYQSSKTEIKIKKLLHADFVVVEAWWTGAGGGGVGTSKATNSVWEVDFSKLLLSVWSK